MGELWRQLDALDFIYCIRIKGAEYNISKRKVKTIDLLISLLQSIFCWFLKKIPNKYPNVCDSMWQNVKTFKRYLDL